VTNKAVNVKAFYILCASRAGTCLGTMAFAGALPVMRNEWDMDAASAGSVQAVFSIANALAVFVASWISDHFGARKVYLMFSWLGFCALTLFALFAHSYSSALVLIALVGLTQGGAYTPALMIAMRMNSLSKRGFAIGAILAAGSFGYLMSVFLASYGALMWGVSVAFFMCAAGALAGAAFGSIALSDWALEDSPNIKTKEGSTHYSFSINALFLLTGYIAHCWELLGNWAWTPSMILERLDVLNLSSVTTGIIVASSVHLSGMFSTLIVGAISDYFNRASVLIFMGAAGALSSILMGVSGSWGPEWAILLAFSGSFFILGDSGVLSAAIADNVDPKKLGRIMGVRSLLGFGIGSLAPLTFGIVMQVSLSWEVAYLVLAAGGLVACISATILRSKC
jgi:MFS family permease